MSLDIQMEPDHGPVKGRRCRKGRKRQAQFHWLLDNMRCHTTLHGVGVVGQLRKQKKGA